MSWLLVFLGGGAGSLARYGLARWLPAGMLPWGTLLANTLACGMLGLGLALATRDVLDRRLQLLLLTGFCGGFSTFSTYVMEAAELAEAGQWGTALGYVALSLLAGLLAFSLAYGLSR